MIFLYYQIKNKHNQETEMNQIAYDNTTPQGTRTIEYMPQGVCSRLIKIEVDTNRTIMNVAYFMGCSGNTQGIAALVKGMKVEEAIKRLEGIRCGGKATSCPDQLAQALKLFL